MNGILLINLLSIKKKKQCWIKETNLMAATRNGKTVYEFK